MKPEKLLSSLIMAGAALFGVYYAAQLFGPLLLQIGRYSGQGAAVPQAGSPASGNALAAALQAMGQSISSSMQALGQAISKIGGGGKGGGASLGSGSGAASSSANKPAATDAFGNPINSAASQSYDP